MAAFLSVASIAALPTKGLRGARRLQEDNKFRPVERADLASELATLELRAGADKAAQTLFRRSLATPTDNSLAQVEWASHRLQRLDVQLAGINVPFASEAHARSAAEDGLWDEALAKTSEWLDDQPFDTDAAILGSYVASVGLEDWPAAVDIAEFGLRSRPGDPTLLNNLAFGLIGNGRLSEASAVLSRTELKSAPERDQVALLATFGLLYFRLGKEERGEAFYERAIELAKRKRLRAQEAMGRAMLLREKSASAGSEERGAMLVVLRNLSAKITDPGVLQCIGRVEKLFS